MTYGSNGGVEGVWTPGWRSWLRAEGSRSKQKHAGGGSSPGGIRFVLRRIKKSCAYKREHEHEHEPPRRRISGCCEAKRNGERGNWCMSLAWLGFLSDALRNYTRLQGRDSSTRGASPLNSPAPHRPSSPKSGPTSNSPQYICMDDFKIPVSRLPQLPNSARYACSNRQLPRSISCHQPMDTRVYSNR